MSAGYMCDACSKIFAGRPVTALRLIRPAAPWHGAYAIYRLDNTTRADDLCVGCFEELVAVAIAEMKSAARRGA